MIFPPLLELHPKPPLNARLKVPGSKSLTNRAFITAALADGETQLEDALIAEDSEVMIRALRDLGFAVTEEGTTFTVGGQGGKIPAASAALDLRLSGTSIRFLAALAALGQGRYRFDGSERMRQRPVEDLLESLRSLGVKAQTIFETGCPPFIIEANGLAGGEAAVSGATSSQFLSALLMAAPYAQNSVTLTVTGELQSKPFIDMTLKLMEDFGVEVARDGYQRFMVTPGRYTARTYPIEGDAMAAGYFWAAAAITGGRVKVENVGQDSCQGDKRLADVLGEMGCRVTWTDRSCEVVAPADGILRGGRFDLNDMPDQAQTLAVVGLFADRPVRIDNVWNMRVKETDRLSALKTELTKFGAEVEEGEDYIVVHPLPEGRHARVEIATYGDHRMAMAFALAGLRLPGVVIHEPGCVVKTFPEFFGVLERL